MFADLFLPAEGSPLEGLYNPWLVLLSVVVAVFTATLALQMVDFAARGARGLRTAAIATGTVALGSGVWAMHFLAMLAFNLCVAVDYDPLITGISMLPSIAASAVALKIISKPSISRADLLAGGVLVGGGIGAMHYVGMAAMQMGPALRYDPGFFALSIVVAVVLAVVALWMRRRQYGLLASGTVMGLAIAGMHYTGMAAARFYGDASLQVPGFSPDTGMLAFGVTLTTALIALLVAAINTLLRFRAMVNELTISESRMAALTATAVDAIISISAEGIILNVNIATERLFGWTTDEMVGQNINMLMPEPYRSEHDGYLSRYLDTGEARIIGSAREVMARRKDGSTFPIRLAVGHARLPEGNMFVGYITDITERRLLEQDLRDAKTRAEQAAAARTAFLANMSHEIRTPMNSILGFAEVLLNSKPTQEQAHALGIMRNSARSLLRLLNEILDSAKLDRGAMELLHLPFDLRALAEEVIAAMTTTADKKAIRLSLDYDDDLPTRFLGDELRVRQVLSNLLGNAVKFTHEGEVALSIAADGGKVHFTLSDTGIGIAADRLERIFDPFTQADASLARRYGGTGLGTTISKQIVELMKGRIWVESEVGRGSHFHVLVPLSPTNLDTVEMSVGGEIPSLPALRILYADDVPQNLELVRMMLEPLGHRLVLVDSGEEALMHTAEEAFDLLLLDIRMPGLSGLETAQRVRQQEREQKVGAVPILALSASVLDEDRNLAFDAGMDGFVAKPIERPVLLREIARVLGVGPADSAPEQVTLLRPVFDRAGALLRWDDDWVVLADMLGRFFTQNRDLARRLDHLLEGGETEAALDLAHKIKGLAGNIGLTELFAALGALETILYRKAGDPYPALEAVAVALDAAWQTVEPELADLDEAAMPAGQRRLDVEALGLALTDLLKAVKRGALDDEALAAIVDMLPKQETQALRQALEDFDFPAAESRINSMMEQRDAAHAR
jgi:PAS domain S-box-containing protein